MVLNEAPAWWNVKGERMVMVRGVRGKLVLKGVFLKNREGAAVSITPDPNRKKGFWVRTKLPHSNGALIQVAFRADQDDLRQMFGITGDSNLTQARKGDWYVREGPYLNIPRTGSGQDGDPNVSVLITSEIQAELSKYLS